MPRFTPNACHAAFYRSASHGSGPRARAADTCGEAGASATVSRDRVLSVRRRSWWASGHDRFSLKDNTKNDAAATSAHGQTWPGAPITPVTDDAAAPFFRADDRARCVAQPAAA